MICIGAMREPLAKFPPAGKRRSACRGIVWIQRPHHVFIGLRRVAIPQGAQLGDRFIVPIHAQVDQREAFALHYQQMRAAHWTVLTTGSQAFFQRPVKSTIWMCQPCSRRAL